MSAVLERIAGGGAADQPQVLAALLVLSFLTWLLIVERSIAYGGLPWKRLWRRRAAAGDEACLALASYNLEPTPENHAALLEACGPANTPYSRFLRRLGRSPPPASTDVWELQVAQAALLGEGEVRRGLPFLALTAKLVLLVGTLGVANGVTEMLRSLAPTAGRDLAAWAPGAAAALATATATVVVAAPTVIALHFLRGQAAAFLDDIRRSARRLAGAHAGPAPEARP